MIKVSLAVLFKALDWGLTGAMAVNHWLDARALEKRRKRNAELARKARASAPTVVLPRRKEP